MIKLTEPHAPGPITFLGLEQMASWRLKLYAIAYQGKPPREALIAATKELAAQKLAALTEIGDRWASSGITTAGGPTSCFWIGGQTKTSSTTWYSSLCARAPSGSRTGVEAA